MSNHGEFLGCQLCGAKNSISDANCTACGAVLYADSAESLHSQISEADSPAAIASERLKAWQQFVANMEDRRSSGHKVDGFLRSAEARVGYWNGILTSGAFAAPTVTAKGKGADEKSTPAPDSHLPGMRRPVPAWAVALLGGLVLFGAVVGRHGLLWAEAALDTRDKLVGYGIVGACAASICLLLVLLHKSWRSVRVGTLVKMALWALGLGLVIPI